jgi:transcription initiation factor TFIID TATA-box-binding protein
LQSKSIRQEQTIAFKSYIDDIKNQVYEKQTLFQKYNEIYRTKTVVGDNYKNPLNLSYDDLELPVIDIVNIVISSKMDLDTDLIKIDKNTEWYPKKFPGFIYRVYHPCKSTLLVFRTGNVICTGTRFINDARRILSTFHNKFKSNPDDNHIPELSVKNLVVQIYFKYRIDVDTTINILPRAIYEPEQFPGIIYRNVEPKAVVLLFVSGKSICVGTDNIDSAFNTIFQLRKMLLDNNLLVLKKTS